MRQVRLYVAEVGESAARPSRTCPEASFIKRIFVLWTLLSLATAATTCCETKSDDPGGEHFCFDGLLEFNEYGERMVAVVLANQIGQEPFDLLQFVQGPCSVGVFVTEPVKFVPLDLDLLLCIR